MKILMTGLSLALGAFMASSAMAAPYEQHRNQQEHRYEQRDRDWDRRYEQRDRDWDHRHDARRYDERRDHDRYEQRYDNRQYGWNRVNPSRDWRSGQTFPRDWDHGRYGVNYRHHKHLPKPGRYQQWYRINGDYVLVNERSNRIIRIID